MLEINNLMTPQEILNICHQYTAMPSVLLAFGVMNIVWWISAILSFNSQSSWKKITLSWFIFMIISLLAVIFIAFSPFTIENIIHPN